MVGVLMALDIYESTIISEKANCFTGKTRANSLSLSLSNIAASELFVLLMCESWGWEFHCENSNLKRVKSFNLIFSPIETLKKALKYSKIITWMDRSFQFKVLNCPSDDSLVFAPWSFSYDLRRIVKFLVKFFLRAPSKFNTPTRHEALHW